MPRTLTRITTVAAGLCLTAHTALAQSPSALVRPDGNTQITRPAPGVTPGHVTWTEDAGGETVYMSGTPGPRFEPAGSPGSVTRAEALRRLELRRKLDWANLNEKQRRMLAPVAVGPDQLNEELLGPISLVTHAWDYTNEYRGRDHQAMDLHLNVDGDVVVGGTTFGQSDGSSPEGFSKFLIAEISGTNTGPQGWTENWEREPFFGSSQYVQGCAVTADLRGNTFICGSRVNGNYTVWHFDGASGSTLSNRAFSTPNNTPTSFNGAVARAIAVDAEGLVYVCGDFRNPDGHRDWFVAQHDPGSNLDRNWIVEMDAGFGGNANDIKVDQLGNIFVGGTTQNDPRVVKLSPYDGFAEWTYTDTSSTDSNNVEAMEIDPNGDIVVTGANISSTNWKTIKVDGETGQEIWRNTESTGLSHDVAIDKDGFVYVAGTPRRQFDNVTSDTHRLEKYHPDTGARIWRRSYGTTGTANRVALDRLGNAYILGTFEDTDGGVDVIKLDIRKYEPDGTLVWNVNRNPKFNSSETNNDLRTEDLVVDAGGSVYAAGWRRMTQVVNPPKVQELGREFFVVKYEQPYVSVPQIATDNADMKIEGRSIWDPTSSSTLLQGFSESFRLFKFNISSILPNLDSTLRRTLDLGVLGSVTGGVDFDLRNAEMDISFDTAATGGTFDATVSGPIAVAVPDEDELFAGGQFDITVGWSADEGTMEFLANAEPDLSALLLGSLDANVDFEIYARNGMGNNIFPPVQILSNNQSNIGVPEFPFFGFDFFPLPPAGTWYDFSAAPDPYDGFVVGKIRSPELSVEGDYLAEQGRFSSSISEKILDARINITNIISWYSTGIPTFASFGTPVGNDSYDANITASLIQAYLRGEVFLEQDLDLDLIPYMRLEFDDPATDPVTIDMAITGSPGDPGYPNFVGTYTYTNGFPSTGELEITPTFGIRATLTNRSGLNFEAFAGFESISLDASLAVAGSDLISIDQCYGCIEQDLLAPNLINGVSSALNEGQFTLLDTTSMEFNFPNEQTMASLQLSGDDNAQPQLIGASREAARMIIYDQRTPSQAQINSAAGGREPMVLYGRKFTTGGNIRARIRHHGRTETLQTTRLNDQALLVEIPQRFFLLPGVARLWVVHNVNGKSETIDFEIQYPTPNFQGIEETPWAADQRFKTQPLTAIDGGTPAGNDSFIARRDYYRNLRMNLWNSGLTVGTTFANAPSYFPGFSGWETQALGPQPPGFPTLVWNGTPLPRFRPSPNDGVYRSRLPLQFFTTPGFYDMQLCNPGPGGGPSRVRTVEVPAPVPVIQRLNVNNVRPGVNEGSVELRVFGPTTVPIFDGFENVKYGNFTGESTVKISGMPVETNFNGPGFLTAFIPPEMLMNPGPLFVTVETPANGTSYHERLLNGDGSVAFDDVVASGGESIPHTINVAWPAPSIRFVSHPTIEQGEPPLVPFLIDGVPPADNLNITINGNNFAPGCTVYLDGNPIPSDRVTPKIVRARIEASDVSFLGPRFITVENPAPNRRESNEMPITIVPNMP